MPMAETCDYHKVITKLSERRKNCVLRPQLSSPRAKIRKTFLLFLLPPAEGASKPHDMGVEFHCLSLMRSAKFIFSGADGLFWCLIHPHCPTGQSALRDGRV